MSDKQEIERLLSYVALSDEEHSRLRKLVAALLAAKESLAKDAEAWKHIANEWADEATNGVQYLRNVRDGISTPEECTRSALENIQRIRALAASASAPVIHVETALEVAAREMRDWGVTLSTKRKGAHTVSTKPTAQEWAPCAEADRIDRLADRLCKVARATALSGDSDAANEDMDCVEALRAYAASLRSKA